MGKKILIVDDEQELRNMIKLRLNAVGFEFNGAETRSQIIGCEAVGNFVGDGSINNFKPDLVFRFEYTVFLRYSSNIASRRRINPFLSSFAITLLNPNRIKEDINDIVGKML